MAGSTGVGRRSCGPSGGGVRRPGTPWERAMPDDFERMWADLAPVGPLGRVRRLLPPALHARRSASCAAWFAEQCAARGLRVETDGFGNRRAGGTRPGEPGPARADRLAPRLRARRRGVRRPARRGLRPGGGRPAARRAGSCRAGRSGWRCSSRRRARASGWPAWARGWPPARRRGSRRASCATATACALGDVVDRAGGPSTLARRRRRRSSSCTSSRAATWSTAAPRSGWPARSGRTGATGSTSPGRPTTPAPPAWRTGADPMLTYAMTALARQQAGPAGRASARPSAGSTVDAQRHQRRAVAGHRLAGRALRRPRTALAELVDDDRAQAQRPGRTRTARR